jgi:hypothetical protein
VLTKKQRAIREGLLLSVPKRTPLPVGPPNYDFSHLPLLTPKTRALLLPDMSPQQQQPSGPCAFFEASLEARKLIYRYLLIPPGGLIFFRWSDCDFTFSNLNPEFQPTIIFAHPQIYRESRNILYGENTFFAFDAEDFFLPTGIDGLRASTAQRIKHIGVFRRGGPRDCDTTSDELARSLYRLSLKTPAFHGLRTLNLNFQCLRPAGLNLFDVQMYLNHHKVQVDARAIYNKSEMVKEAAAMIAFQAERKGAPFQGLTIQEDLIRHEMTLNGKSISNSMISLTLFRTQEPANEYEPEAMALSFVTYDMMRRRRIEDIPGSYEEFKVPKNSLVPPSPDN